MADYSHQVGPVPVAVEAAKRVVFECLKAFKRADGQTFGVLRSVEDDRELLIA